MKVLRHSIAGLLPPQNANRLTPMEEEALDALEDLRDSFCIKKFRRVEFQEAMGNVRDMISKLRNKKLGCPTGKHTSYCECQ